jgi:hypothetical protein
MLRREVMIRSFGVAGVFGMDSPEFLVWSRRFRRLGTLFDHFAAAFFYGLKSKSFDV